MLIYTQQDYCLSLLFIFSLHPLRKVTWYRAGWVRDTSSHPRSTVPAAVRHPQSRIRVLRAAICPFCSRPSRLACGSGRRRPVFIPVQELCRLSRPPRPLLVRAILRPCPAPVRASPCSRLAPVRAAPHPRLRRPPSARFPPRAPPPVCGRRRPCLVCSRSCARCASAGCRPPPVLCSIAPEGATTAWFCAAALLVLLCSAAGAVAPLLCSACVLQKGKGVFRCGN